MASASTIEPNFDFITDKYTRIMLETAYQAVTNTNMWDFVGMNKTSFMFSSDNRIWAITEEIERLGYRGHSEASFGYIMRTMQFIANHGLDEFKKKYLSENEHVRREKILVQNSEPRTNFAHIKDNNELCHGSYLKYYNTDVYSGMETHVMPPESEFNDVVLEAAKRGCNVIVRKGGGQWYLKGYGKDYEDTKRRIEDNLVTESMREEDAKTHRNLQVWLLQIRVGIITYV